MESQVEGEQAGENKMEGNKMEGNNMEEIKLRDTLWRKTK